MDKDRQRLDFPGPSLTLFHVLSFSVNIHKFRSFVVLVLLTFSDVLIGQADAALSKTFLLRSAFTKSYSLYNCKSSRVACYNISNSVHVSSWSC